MPAIMIAIALGIIALTVMDRRGSMKAHYEEKRRLRHWRERHGMPPEVPVQGPPPMPMHIKLKQSGEFDPRMSISTQDTDKFLAAVRRIFASRRSEA